VYAVLYTKEYVFLYENIDTNKLYVGIFKHSFLKWTVGEKNHFLTGCSLDQSLSVTNSQM